MKYGKLADCFSGFGYKRLKPVEIDPEVSHGHEFNGISQFKQLFGLERRTFNARLIYLADDTDELPTENITFTWYDARENNPDRTEHRLYYKESAIISMAAPEDLMVVAVNSNAENQLTVLIAKKGDIVESQLAWVFGFSLETVTDAMFKVQNEGSKELDYFSSMILERAGIQNVTEDISVLDRLLAAFPDGFPKTSAFSEFSRTLVPEVSVHDNADAALMAWLEAEENAFKVFEHYQIQQKIRTGFSNVDEFIAFSLTVQNRRKSRAGHALENQLKFIFEQMNVRFTSQAYTEAHSKPDFLFPGIKEYKDVAFPAVKLTMLGAKTTCKDRWPQVLSEAARIEHKHLITLEAGITEYQTDKMAYNKLQLVVPRQIFSSYTPRQQNWLWNVEDFIQYVLRKQNG